MVRFNEETGRFEAEDEYGRVGVGSTEEEAARNLSLVQIYCPEDERIAKRNREDLN